MGKLFSPDEENFIYAIDIQQAKEFLKEEFGWEYETSDIEEYPLDTVVSAVEMVGIGGYNEIYAISIIQHNERKGIQAPYLIEVDDYY